MFDTGLLSDDKKRNLSWAAIAGGVILAAGLFFGPDRAWSNLLVATFYLLTIA
jgi:hypothetical protein